jgi:hypothetical protein
MRIITNEEMICVAGGIDAAPAAPEGQDGFWSLVDGPDGAQWLWTQRVTVTASKKQQSDAWNGVVVSSGDCFGAIGIGSGVGGALGAAVGGAVAGAISTAWTGPGALAGAAIGLAGGLAVAIVQAPSCKPAKPSYVP